MKVAFMLGSLNRGGTETLLLDVLGQSGNAPFEMMVIYRKDGELIDNFRSLLVPVYHVKTDPAWLFWIYLLRLRNLLQQEKPDIIHTQQSLDTVYAYFACRGLPIKIVQTFHGYDFGLGYFNKLLIKMSQKMALMNIFVSKTQAAYYQKTYSGLKSTNCKVVYNGVNFDKFQLSSNSSIRAELGVSRDMLLLGMVGNFVKVRDQMTVCRFLKKLSLHRSDFLFLFIGKKDEKNPQLMEDCQTYCRKNGIAEKVLFTGPRSDIPSLLPQLDAFIYSTDHDTFGLAVIEAIASGIPVFVNDWEVMTEITAYGEHAIMYRTKDETDLYEKFSKWLKNRENFSLTVIENMIWIRKKFNIQAHLKQLDEVYSQLV